MAVATIIEEELLLATQRNDADDDVTGYDVTLGGGGALEGTPIQAHYRRIAEIFGLSVLPLILFLGILGNGLSLAVLQSRYYRTTSTGFLLSALAILDTMSLLTGLLRRWIGMLTDWEVDVRMSSNGACVGHMFLTYLCQALGSWTLVVFTVERTISVYMPLQVKTICSRKRVVGVWVAVMVLVTGFYSQLLGLVSLDGYVYHGRWTPGCNFKPRYGSSMGNGYDVIFSWLDLVIFAFIPWCIIVTCNLMIITRLIYNKRIASAMTAPSCGQGGKRQAAVTVVLLSVSLVFMLTTMPYGLYYATYSLIPKNTPQQKGQDSLAFIVINAVYFVNNAINFLLYCLSAERFRRAFAAVLCRVTHAPQDGATPSTQMTSMKSTRRPPASDVTRKGDFYHQDSDNKGGTEPSSTDGSPPGGPYVITRRVGTHHGDNPAI